MSESKENELIRSATSIVQGTACFGVSVKSGESTPQYTNKELFDAASMFLKQQFKSATDERPGTT